MNTELWWYSARAGGLVAWALLTASVIWGLVLSTKLRPPRVRPAWTLDLHRFLGGLAAIFTVVHVGSILLDSYTSFGLADVLVPFASSWRPSAVAWGVVGLYLLAAVELTSLARRHLPHRWWRRIHVLSLPLFGVATMHFVTAGSDAGSLPAVAAITVASLTVVALLAHRLNRLRRPPARPSRLGGAPDLGPLAPPATAPQAS